MKDGVPQPFDQSIFRNKLEGVEQSAGPFHHKGADDDFLHQAYDPAQPVHIVSLLDHDPFFDSDPLPEQEEKGSHTGHHAQTADLDQQHQDDLPEQGKLRRRCDGDKPGHTHRSG